MNTFIEWLLGIVVWSDFLQFGQQLLHVCTGLLLVSYHGLHKLHDGLAWRRGESMRWPFLDEVREAGFPFAESSAWLATMAQLGGGLCLMLGFLTRPAAMLLLATLLGALYTTVRLKKDSQMALVYLLLVLIVALWGPGPWSLDAWFVADLWKGAAS